MSETTHELKVWPEYGAALTDLTKSFEYRVDDRRFAVGDVLHLREWNYGSYTGKEWHRRITYIARGGLIPSGFCVMSIVPAPLDAGRATGEETEGDLTSAYMVGYEQGKDAALTALRARLDASERVREATLSLIHDAEMYYGSWTVTQIDHFFAALRAALSPPTQETP